MRADRLVSTLLLLQNHGRMTARQLAARLEVSQRTVHRDMSALSSAGVPVVADRGAHGGWSLMPGYRASISALNEAEVRALFVGTPGVLLDDLRLHRASDDAALKLLSILPSVTRKSAELARQRIHIDLSGWKQSRDAVPFLPILQEAVFSDRTVRFTYGEHERVAEALGLVAKGSVWYFVGRVAEDVRTYRVSRVTDAQLLAETFVRPGDFNLAEYWRSSAAQFKEKLPRYEVIARTKDATRLAVFIRYGAIDSIDGEIVHLHFDSEEVAIATFLGADAEVIEPIALREKIVAAARSAIARYGTPATSTGLVRP